MIDQVLNVGQAVLNEIHHRTELDQSQKLHHDSLKVDHELHAENIQINKHIYLLEEFMNLEQHFQQLNADLISSSKESERDMFDQRNQQFQTIILSSSVMFSALSTVIIQGPLSYQSSSFLLISYSLTSALSFAILFLSIVICIEIISRASKFMYERARYQSQQLDKALKQSKDMVKDFRSNSWQDGLIDGDPDKILEIWKEYGKVIFRLLDDRDSINELVQMGHAYDEDPIVGGEINVGKTTFEKFWKLRCSRWGEIAILLFYVGSVMFLFSVMIFMYSEFYFTYSNVSGAVVAIVLIGVGMFLGVMIVIVLRVNTIFYRNTHEKNDNDATADVENGNNNNNNNGGDEETGIDRRSRLQRTDTPSSIPSSSSMSQQQHQQQQFRFGLNARSSNRHKQHNNSNMMI